MATTFAVPDGRVAMAATLYTGNGSTQSISNAVNTVGMQPDLVWIKNRNSTYYNELFDSIRGVGKVLYSNTTDAESTQALSLTSFNSSGFSTSSDAGVNGSALTYVGWQWKAGGTAVSNTAGTITSSVSANTTAGFSIVVYTGNGTNGATVGHGLGAKPSLIIEKGRSTTYNWSVQGCGVLWTPATSTLFLNTTAALNVSGAVAAPTTSVFTPSATNYANESGVSNVAYCWAPVAGYSAFGSYTGNGSADGPFIYTGFRPRYVLWKRTDQADSWVLRDTARDPYNQGQSTLFAESAAAESTASRGLDYLSNGFKLRQSIAEGNASGGTCIYAAFAENPLRYSNAR